MWQPFDESSDPPTVNGSRQRTEAAYWFPDKHGAGLHARCVNASCRWTLAASPSSRPSPCVPFPLARRMHVGSLQPPPIWRLFKAPRLRSAAHAPVDEVAGGRQGGVAHGARQAAGRKHVRVARAVPAGCSAARHRPWRHGDHARREARRKRARAPAVPAGGAAARHGGAHGGARQPP